METILLSCLIITILVMACRTVFHWLERKLGSGGLSTGKVLLKMHDGVLLPSNLPCYFLTVCNFSSLPSTVTHVWMETADPASGLPRQVQLIFPGWGPILPSDVREACVPKELFPDVENWFLCGRIRLSDGPVLESTLDLNVPPHGAHPRQHQRHSDLCDLGTQACHLAAGGRQQRPFPGTGSRDSPSRKQHVPHHPHHPHPIEDSRLGEQHEQEDAPQDPSRRQEDPQEK